MTIAFAFSSPNRTRIFVPQITPSQSPNHFTSYYDGCQHRPLQLRSPLNPGVQEATALAYKAYLAHLPSKHLFPGKSEQPAKHPIGLRLTVRELQSRRAFFTDAPQLAPPRESLLFPVPYVAVLGDARAHRLPCQRADLGSCSRAKWGAAFDRVIPWAVLRAVLQGNP